MHTPHQLQAQYYHQPNSFSGVSRQADRQQHDRGYAAHGGTGCFRSASTLKDGSTQQMAEHRRNITFANTQRWNRQCYGVYRRAWWVTAVCSRTTAMRQHANKTLTHLIWFLISHRSRLSILIIVTIVFWTAYVTSRWNWRHIVAFGVDTSLPLHLQVQTRTAAVLDTCHWCAITACSAVVYSSPHCTVGSLAAAAVVAAAQQHAASDRAPMS